MAGRPSRRTGSNACQNTKMTKSQLVRGLALFDQGEYFAAHEVLEDLWRAAPRGEKNVWQGLVQLAVAFHHHKMGNIVGAHSVMRKALANLSTSDFALASTGKRLLANIRKWIKYLEQGGQVPRVPHLTSISFVVHRAENSVVNCCKRD